MKYRFLIGASVALATALSCADARAQMGPIFPTGAPTVWYFGPEGGWTSLTNQPNTATIPGGVFGAGSPPEGITATSNTDDRFNAGVRGGVEWGPWRFEEEFNFRQTGINSLSARRLTVATQGDRN